MRVVLDLQGAQGMSRFRGIGRYTLSFAQAIVRQPGDHEIIVALSDLFPETVEPIRELFDGELPQERIRVWKAPGPTQAREPANAWRRATAARLREAFIASLEPDLVHLSEPFGGFSDDVVGSVATPDARFQTTVSLYDLIPLVNPASYLASNPPYERHFNAALAQVKRADGWLTISESATREALDLLALDPDSVVNVSAACDSTFRRIDVSADDERDLRARLGLSRPFVMYSGGSDPRKNLDRLIQAYAGLPPPVRQAHHLVLVGKMHQTRAEALQATARAAGLGPEDVRITDYAEDEDLVRLYNLCTLFVLPSVHEGFGMPALEAMSCGAPVVGSNTSSLPEVIGWPEAMFDPLDVAAMTARMERALTDDAFRAELIARGARRAEAFSWDESARRAIAAFERIHARHAERQVRRTVASEVAVARLVGDVRGIPGKPADRDLIATARAIAINHPKKRRRRLIVDVSYLIGRGYGTGIHRVVRSMITWLPSVLPAGYRMELAYATVDNPYRRARWDRPEHGMGRVATTTVVLDPRPGDVFLGLDLAQRIVAAQAGFYAELRRLGIPVSFVVYDLLPLFLPHRFPPEVEDVHRRWLEVVAAADGAICISGAVADELRSWVEIHGRDRRRPLRIGSFHLGADIEATDHTSGLPDDAAETLQALAARPTFLLVGTLEPRKGHVQTLDAFERLWNDEVDVNLVLVGKAGWHMEPFLARLNGHPEMGKRLYWLESASDDYLDAIYRAASCLIAPSEGEGFGLPLIEAAQHGTPLLVRDIPVFREVAGDHASYFDGADAASLADAVHAWLSSWQQGLHPRSDDMPWLTWQESARQLVTVLFDGSL